ncbi:HNH endonuclease [Desulfovibrio subterraneus]|uniref:HNH endonuclease n=1 Tax=Desulfovibrio subterraneus TaxID=2718620 RepID=A0A7J0BFD6_9BACT|nr:HNH endonuclease [Desulfovibrio subterraneus]GFM32420.1 hypothetical protein DSM101010T_07850 [Desulfovibrio subterraneus]
MKPSICKKKEWENFRTKILEIDNFRCTKCGRGREDGVVLQVHHKKYIRGRQLWQYDYDDCATLCKGCHAETHCIIMPKTNWVLAYHEDLGDLVGTCELCGSSLRHAYFIEHEHWQGIIVGTYCCDNLTDTTLASNHIESQNRYNRRLKTFLNSSKWFSYNDRELHSKNYICSHSIDHKKHKVVIIETTIGYFLRINFVAGETNFSSFEEAKEKAFFMIESGTFRTYVEKKAGKDQFVRRPSNALQSALQIKSN